MNINPRRNLLQEENLREALMNLKREPVPYFSQLADLRRVALELPEVLPARLLPPVVTFQLLAVIIRNHREAGGAAGTAIDATAGTGGGGVRCESLGVFTGCRCRDAGAAVTSGAAVDARGNPAEFPCRSPLSRTRVAQQVSFS